MEFMVRRRGAKTRWSSPWGLHGGRHGVGAELVQNCILPDEGQLMWPCFLQDGRKCWLRGHVTDVHKPLISAGKVLGKDKLAILHSSGGSILSWNSPTGILISRAMTKGTRQARTDELIKLYKENNILQLPREGFRWKLAGAKLRHRCCFPTATPRQCSQLSGGQLAGSVGKSRSQAVRPIAAAASSSGSRGEQNTDMDVERPRPGKNREERRGVWRIRSGSPPPNLLRKVERKMTSFRGPEE